MVIVIHCPHCSDEELELAIVVTFRGAAAVFSLPENSYPGDPAEWYIENDPLTCEACGHVFTEDEVSALQESEKIHAEVEKQIAENSDEPEPDYYDVDDSEA